jgi:hypothetical protein
MSFWCGIAGRSIEHWGNKSAREVTAVQLVSRALIGLILAVTLVIAGYYVYLRFVGNSGVVEELRTNPGGERAARAMLITLPDGRELPVNYLREGDMVYLGVDGLWWREFREGAQPVTLLIRGQTLSGQAVAILDDPARTEAVFARLRPTAPAWLPGRMRGVLVQVTLNEE